MARPRNINRRIAEQGVRLAGAGITIAPQTTLDALLGLREQKTTPDTSGATTDALASVLASMTETEFQWHVRTALEVRGWRCYVVPDMRKTLAGLPDILALHPQYPLLLALELKSATGRVKPKQREFRDMAVRVPGVVARVVRPSDWPALRDALDDLEARNAGRRGGVMSDERAERAILSHAEAYRLVEEARQMREERDALAAEMAALRGLIVAYLDGSTPCHTTPAGVQAGREARSRLRAALGVAPGERADAHAAIVRELAEMGPFEGPNDWMSCAHCKLGEWKLSWGAFNDPANHEPSVHLAPREGAGPGARSVTARSWRCKARAGPNGRPCSEELGIVESGRLFVRVGLVVTVGPDSTVTVGCPASLHHHRVWQSRDCATISATGCQPATV